MVHQGDQVLPLRDGRVLKFIDKDVAESAAHPFKQERHWVVPHHTGNPFVKGMEGSDIAGFLNLFHFVRNGGKRAH